MIASTYFDPVLGIDFHLEIVPASPAPVPFPHPFVGMVFDPIGLVAGLVISNAFGMLLGGAPPKGPVFINLLPATNTGTDAPNTYTMPHVVIPPGVAWTPLPKPIKPKIGTHDTPTPDLPIAPAGDAVLMMGSKTVDIMGSKAVRLGELAMSCTEPVRLPSSFVLAIPKGLPVLIGGFPSIDWGSAAGALLRSRWAAGLLHGLISRLPAGRLRSLLHWAACTLTGHPVDVATGRVLALHTDLELPGPLPLKLLRQYDSNWAARPSPLGFGWSHSLDQAVWLEPGKIVYRAEDGRELEIDTFDLPGHTLPVGGERFEPLHRLTVRRIDAASFEIDTPDGVTRRFFPVTGDASGTARLVELRDRAGSRIVLKYDRQGLLFQVVDSAGRILKLEHNALGQLTALWVPRERAEGWRLHRRYGYSSQGDLIEVRDGLDAAWQMAYEGHLLVQEKDRAGLSFYFGYDGVGSSARCVRTWGDGGIFDHELLYDPENRVTMVTDSLGATTVYQMNPLNQVVKKVDPHGAATCWEYDDLLRKTAEIDPLGLATRYAYDARGNTVEIAQPDGGIVRIAYDARDLPVEAQDPLEHRWSWEYDSRGRMTAHVNPLGERAQYRYEGVLLRSIERPGGLLFELLYDHAGNLAAVKRPDGAELRNEYDRLGQRLVTRGPDGNITRQWYDVCGRLTLEEQPDGRKYAFAYDPEGNLIETRSADRLERLQYTGYHKLARRMEAGTELELRYDTEDQLRAVVNEAGEVYHFTRDACGRVKEEQGFDGRTRRYTHDKVGRVVRMVRPGNGSSDIAYDPMGRVLSVNHSDGSWEAFGYRLDGALIEARNGETTVHLERDPVGHIRRERQGEAWVASRYDASGMRVESETSEGLHQSILRNRLGDVLEVAVTSPDRAEPWRAVFQRDVFGLEAGRRLPGGIETQWRRDVAGRPEARNVTRNGIWQESQAYHWEGDDRLTSIRDRARGVRQFQHDARNRLVSARFPDDVVQYLAPDLVGNVYRQPDRSGRQYGAGGVLKEAEGTRYVHDADGQLIEKCLPDGATWRYQWTGAGMLREVERPDGTKITFGYDALGRRIWKESAGLRTRWMWDGDVPIHEQTEGHVPVTWVFEPGSFTPLAKLEGEARYGVASDHLGIPLALYDESGEAGWKAELDIYGQVRAVEAGATRCPWRFPGQYEDEETGLYYNRFRYYDPGVGRYISQDPIGLEGGLNPFAFLADPFLESDVFGLATWVDPSTLNYSQAYVTSEATAYESLMRRDVSQGGWNWNLRPDTHPEPSALRVANINGQLVSLDNRRLFAAQNVGLKSVPIIIVDINGIRPGTSITWGESLRRRLNSIPDGFNVPIVQLPEDGTKQKPTMCSR